MRVPSGACAARASLPRSVPPTRGTRRTGAGADYLKAFIDEMVASGFIARSIEKNGVKGLAAIAPKKN